MSVVKEKLKLLPDNPGVYIMLDKEGKVIYVGKAKNLKNRVRQYFFTGVKTNKVMAMVLNIADFNYIITKTEIDALSLENNLIKKYKPKYNILLKDDKTYPYIKINLKDEFPSFTVTRKLLKDGAKYFGPFMGGINVKDVLEIITMCYPRRPCAIKIEKNKPRKECLNYHIGKCLSPCSGKCTKEEYKSMIEGAIDFLNGNDKLVEKILKEKMQTYAERQEFENAISCRDRLNNLDKIKQKRITAISRDINADVIGVETNGIFASVNVLFVRKGKMLGAKNFSFDKVVGELEELTAEFISRYYVNGVELPDEIVVSEKLTDGEVLEKYLEEKFSKKPSIIQAKQGVRKQLTDMALANAREYLEKNVDKIKHKEDMTVKACQKLQEILNLSGYPKRIECYDISNVSGTDKVGSMVVFNDGEPDKNSYRRFRIKTVEGANDYASLQEVLRRRLSKLGTSEEEKFARPDLIVIDGGKGQLSSVKEVFDEMNIEIDLISLAEREEEIFTLDSKKPIKLEKSHYSLRLLQRIRDEAHRFAITYHKNLRGKRALSSILEEIQGIGKIKRQALMEYFKDVGKLMSASKEELMKVNGIGEKQADLIIEYFTKGEKQ